MRKRIDGMLVASFLATIFYSMTYPHIYKEIVTAASSSVIAAVQVMNCVSTLLFGIMWNKKSDALFRLFPLYCAIETILGVSSTVYAILTGNIVAYYVLDAVVFSVATRNIICGGHKIKAIRYATKEERERFDNNDTSVAAIATIIGSLAAVALNLNFFVMLCIATFGNAIDNAFYVSAYLSVRKKDSHKFSCKH